MERACEDIFESIHGGALIAPVLFPLSAVDAKLSLATAVCVVLCVTLKFCFFRSNYS